MTVIVTDTVDAIVPQLPDVNTCVEFAYSGAATESVTTNRVTVTAGQAYTFGPYGQAFNVSGAQCQLDALLYDSDVAYVPGIVTDGLVAHYQAERALLGTGPGVNSPLTTQFFDISGNGNHGTLTNFDADAADGYRGAGTLADPYRLLFDPASGDYVSLPLMGLCVDKDFTVELCGVMPSGTVNEYLWSEKTATVNCASLRFPTATRVYALLSDGTTTKQVSSTASLTDGGQHTIAYTCSPTTLSLYVDGAATGTPQDVSTLTMPTPTGHTIGSYGTLMPTSAAIICVRLYNRALSLAEVQQNYAAGPLAPYPGIYRTVNLATLSAQGGWARHVDTITPAAPEDALAMRLTFSPT